MNPTRIVPLKCEAASPNTDWQRAWRLALSVKRITLVQMVVTMLRNTRPELHSELRVSMMEQLATKMMISGYPADFRRGVLELAVKCYEHLLIFVCLFPCLTPCICLPQLYYDSSPTILPGACQPIFKVAWSLRKRVFCDKF